MQSPRAKPRGEVDDPEGILEGLEMASKRFSRGREGLGKGGVSEMDQGVGSDEAEPSFHNFRDRISVILKCKASILVQLIS